MNRNSNLSDKAIREALKLYLNRKSKQPCILVDELSVHNGNAIADVVKLTSNFHCYEIKSDRDTLTRLNRQIKFYDSTFKKSTLVTTERYLAKAEEILPNHWGILIAKEDNSVKFVNYRNAKINKNWNATKALLTLWKSELVELDFKINGVRSVKNITRAQLIEFIVSNKKDNVIQKNFLDILVSRFSSERKRLDIVKTYPQ